MPATIAAVVERLQAIVQECARAGDRLGYFAALYQRVTMRVRDGIAAGEFQDGARMEALDVAFANRYLDAYDALRAGDQPSRSWLCAFEAARGGGATVLQHLLLGMNAHIN